MELTRQQLEANWEEHLHKTEHSINTLVKRIPLFKDFFHFYVELFFSIFLLVTGRRYAWGVHRLHPDQVVYFVSQLIKPSEFLYDSDYRLSMLSLLQSDLENTERNQRILSVFDFRNKNQVIMKRKIITSLKEFVGKHRSSKLRINHEIDSNTSSQIANLLFELNVIDVSDIQNFNSFISNPEGYNSDPIQLKKPNYITAHLFECLDLFCNRSVDSQLHIIAAKKGCFISNHHTKKAMTSKEWCAARKWNNSKNSSDEIDQIDMSLKAIFS